MCENYKDFWAKDNLLFNRKAPTKGQIILSLTCPAAPRP